jgi:SET domain-containing protein
LGGFINHSEEPNCKLREVGHEMYLQTIQKIKAGEELTLKYQMYNPVEIKDE